MMRHAEVRQKKLLGWLRPDAKAQVTIRYIDGRPRYVDTVVVSSQHVPQISIEEVREAITRDIIFEVIPAELITRETKYLVNPAGPFTFGGPAADTGLTGRKIVVDSYGGVCPVGGGAFSGKDASKVDRSGAYAARYMAKNIVAAGLSDRCTVQLAYAIGCDRPVSVMIDLHGSTVVDSDELTKFCTENFPTSPSEIIEEFSLNLPIFAGTTNYGHFGRTEAGFAWERCDKISALTSLHAGAIHQSRKN